MGDGFPFFLVFVPYCVFFENLLMNWVAIIDKVRIVVAVDVAPIFELRELLPYVRHCGALREGGVHTSGSGFASTGRTT